MNTLRGFGQMTIGGAARPFHVGTNQTAIFSDLHGMDLAQYGDMFASLLPTLDNKGEVVPPKRKFLTPAENRDFIYSSLAAGAQRERLPVDFDAQTVGDWIDEADEEEAAKPMVMHLRLLQERLNRQMERVTGNAPAPLTVSKGGKAKGRPKKK